MEITKNPFFVLGATTRDNRQHIMRLAEEKGLLCDEDFGEVAAVLTNPRKRLSAETAWFPGLGPRRISEIMVVIESDPTEFLNQVGLPALARANLFAFGLKHIVKDLNCGCIVEWIIELAKAYEDLDAETLISLINEDRGVAGFPKMLDLGQLGSELKNRERDYGVIIRNGLDELPSEILVRVVTQAVEQTTNGKAQVPILIKDLVESYEASAQEFFEREGENISDLSDWIEWAAKDGADESYIDQMITEFENVVRNWDMVAQPIQLIARSQGNDHSLSHEVSSEIRELYVKLFNEYGLLDVSKRLTVLQQEVFAEVDRVVEKSMEDTSALDEIASERARFIREMEEKAESWRKEITYEADIGILKEKLRISPDGVEWKDITFPLDKITKVRWGGTRHSGGLVDMGSTYYISIGDGKRRCRIKLKREEVFSEFINRLWRTVGVRLLTEMLEGLQRGECYRFGEAVVSDYGIELEQPRLFWGSERVLCKWTELVIGSNAGYFRISRKGNKKMSADLSYQDMDNVHILEGALRTFWKKSSPRISDLLTRTN